MKPRNKETMVEIKVLMARHIAFVGGEGENILWKITKPYASVGTSLESKKCKGSKVIELLSLKYFKEHIWCVSIFWIEWTKAVHNSQGNDLCEFGSISPHWLAFAGITAWAGLGVKDGSRTDMRLLPPPPEIDTCCGLPGCERRLRGRDPRSLPS